MDDVAHARKLREQLNDQLPNGVGNTIDALCELVEELEADLQAKPADPEGLVKIAQAVAFYADPENWHGVYMVGRGPMAKDWSKDFNHPQYPGGKPGKFAREAIEAYVAERDKTSD